MPKEDPLDEGLNFIKKLLNLIEKNLYSEKDIKTLIELNKKVMEIESTISQIDKNIDNELLRSHELSIQDIHKIEDGVIPETIQGESRKVAEKALELKDKLEILKNEVEKIRGPYKREKEVEQKEIKENKYKRLRRKEDWKQL